MMINGPTPNSSGASNDYVSRLKSEGIGSGTCVGLCVDRSCDAIAAMFAVMKLGGIFVPLDPDYPADRLAYMIDDASIATIVGNRSYKDLFACELSSEPFGGTVAWIPCESISDGRMSLNGDDASSVSPPLNSRKGRSRFRQESQAARDSGESHHAKNGPAPEDLAYLMYTSGSTGKPKGVQIDHRALSTYCDADIDVYRLTPEDRTLQFSTLCFDIAIEEVFPPLIMGGCVVIRPRQRSADRNELSAIVERHGITAIHLATAYFHQWVDLMVATGDRIPESIRLMIVTGEKVSVAHYRRWQSLCDHEVLWCNAYGPTEATVTSTVFIPDDSFDAANMPIGKPLKHYTVYILDADDQPLGCDQGQESSQTGELYIGGPALAVGYHGRDDLTEAAFRSVEIDGQSKRLYRTGDLARWLPDGNIDFAGRVDHQIKLGSYRIEPGEIEAVIDRSPGVLESLVTFDEVDGKKFLLAYVAHGQQPIDLRGLVDGLRSQLPVYMVPSRYVLLPSFPQTINGKIDRDALPSPESAVVPSGNHEDEPRNDLERRLVEIWKDVLNLPSIGIHDDFFAYGGSSLLVVQVISQLTTDLQVELPVRDFFANPTIASAARHIASLAGEIENESDQDFRREIRQRLPVIEPFYFPSDNEQLFAVHYRPPVSNDQDKRFHCVVIAPSIGHEYTRGHRNLQQIAKDLAVRGFNVLRFDYAGVGNSTGDAMDMTFESMCQNLTDAVRHARQLADTHSADTSDVSLLGLRWGATAAAAIANADANAGFGVDQCVLWDPVVSGTGYIECLEQFHRRQLSGLTRFNRNRRSNIDQLYGDRFCEAKRESLSRVHLDLSSREKLTWIQSAGEPAIKHAGHNCRVVEVPDQIFWSDRRYTESAFSSPQVQRSIIDVFEEALS